MKMLLLFGMTTMKNYKDLYLKCYVLLLADVFEKFKNNSLKIMSYSESLFERMRFNLG